MGKLLSIVVPAFNEEENIQKTYETVGALMEEAKINYELIFVSDGSTDRTYGEIRRLSHADPRVRGIEFSRNFGKESAILAGLEKGCGDCFVVMDCDLQHPPETIIEMYRLWENGYEVVEGIKNSRGKERKLHQLFAHTFYRIISKMTGFDMNNTSDFKLIDKRVADILIRMPEKKPFFRALTFWVGFKSAQVHYDVAERSTGTSKWSVVGLIKYAVSNVISFSTVPLNIVTYIGALGLIIGLVLGVQTLIRWFCGNAIEGFTTVILLLLFLGGSSLIGLGLIGLYVAAIYDEVKQRPRYLIRCDTDEEPDGEGDRDE